MPRYNPYNNPESGYQSMFVAPVDMNLVNQNLQQSQGRWDQSAAMQADTESKLNEMRWYDQAAGKEAIKGIENDFQDVYKNYNGDLGAARNDVLNVIANHRSNPIFQLNEIALEKKKLYDAMAAQYGNSNLEVFKSMPKSLRDENGRLLDQSAFDFDAEKRLDQQKLRTELWAKYLHEERSEGVPDQQGITKTFSGVSKTGQIARKVDGVFNDYKDSPEYKQEVKMLKRDRPDLDDQTKIDAEIRNRIKTTGENFAYGSVSLDRMAGFTGGKGNGNGDNVFGNYDAFFTPITQTTQTNSGNTLPNISAIKEKAVSTDDSPDAFDARQKILQASSNKNLQFKSAVIADAFRQLGLKPDDYMKNGIIINPYTHESVVDPSGNYYGFDKIVSWIPGAIDATRKGFKSGINVSLGNKEEQQTKPQEVKKLEIPKTKEGKVVVELLNKYIKEYNNQIDNNLSSLTTGDYKDFKWHKYNPRLTNDSKDQKIVEYQQELLKNAVLDISPTQYEVEDGPLKFLNTKNTDKYSTDEIKLKEKFFNKNSEVSAGWGEHRDLKFEIKAPDGDISIIKPKSLTTALAIAGTSNKLRQAVYNDFIDFRTDSDKFYIKENGKIESNPLPNGLKIKETTNGYYSASKDGNPITIKDYGQQLGNDAYHEALSKGADDVSAKQYALKTLNGYLSSLKSYYNINDDNVIMQKPALFRNKSDVAFYFDLIPKKYFTND